MDRIALSRTLPACVLATLWLGGCATFPEGPSVIAYPGTGKTFDQFRGDDRSCRDYALEYIGGKTPHQLAQASAVESAALGTAIGAAAGALIGGGHGVGVGAGTGLVVGSAVGAGSADQSGYGTQRRYDIAYLQCMYAKGQMVPTNAGFIPPPGAVPAYPNGARPY